MGSRVRSRGTVLVNSRSQSSHLPIHLNTRFSRRGWRPGKTWNVHLDSRCQHRPATRRGREEGTRSAVTPSGGETRGCRGEVSAWEPPAAQRQVSKPCGRLGSEVCGTPTLRSRFSYGGSRGCSSSSRGQRPEGGRPAQGRRGPRGFVCLEPEPPLPFPASFPLSFSGT